jgi:hypothetical protein
MMAIKRKLLFFIHSPTTYILHLTRNSQIAGADALEANDKQPSPLQAAAAQTRAKKSQRKRCVKLYLLLTSHSHQCHKVMMAIKRKLLSFILYPLTKLTYYILQGTPRLQVLMHLE